MKAAGLQRESMEEVSSDDDTNPTNKTSDADPDLKPVLSRVISHDQVRDAATGIGIPVQGIGIQLQVQDFVTSPVISDEQVRNANQIDYSDTFDDTCGGEFVEMNQVRVHECRRNMSEKSNTSSIY